MGSVLALASGVSVLEPGGIGSLRHRGSFWQLLKEATPVVPPLPNPAMQTQCRLLKKFRLCHYEFKT